MRTVTLNTGEVVKTAVYKKIWKKLKSLQYKYPDEFFRLVKSCRHSSYEIKKCIWTVDMCRSNNHEDCMDIGPYDGLIKSLDDKAHAEIDPIVRMIVLAATPALLMPRLISPLA